MDFPDRGRSKDITFIKSELVYYWKHLDVHVLRHCLQAMQLKTVILVCIRTKQRKKKLNTKIKDKQIKTQNFNMRFVVIVVIKSTCNELRWDYFAPLIYLS